MLVETNLYSARQVLNNNYDIYIKRKIKSTINPYEGMLKQWLPYTVGNDLRLRKKRQEECYCATFDSSGILCNGIIILGEGNKFKVNPDIRLLWEYILYKESNKFVLIHNHPNDSILPSKADLEFSNRIINAGKIFGIKLVDHIIITPNQYIFFLNGGGPYEW